MSNLLQSSYTALNGLITIESNDIYTDTITSDYYGLVPQSKLNYLSTTTSDIQTQIDNIYNTQLSTVGGGFFGINGEFGALSSGYNVAYGRSVFLHYLVL